MRYPDLVRPVLAAAVVLAAASAFAQNKPAAPPPTATDGPDQASLTVGAMETSSAAALAIAGIDIGVAAGNVAYAYYLRNTGSADVALTASVSLPDLQASANDSETWVLSSNQAENPIGLAVTVGGAPVTTKADVHAYALGLDRTSEIKAEHLPLIPFGPVADKALAALSHDAADRLAALGIVSPRDPAQPNEPAASGWTLRVVHSWRLTLPAGKTTPVEVKFKPIVAEYQLGKADLDSVDDLKDDVCLRPAALNAIQARLKNGGVWKVTDLTVDVTGPTNWNDNASPTLSVQKPGPNAIIAFCGIDEKTVGKPAVLGTAPDDSEEVRIVMFQPMAK